MVNKRGLKFSEFLEAFPSHFVVDGNMVRISSDQRPKVFDKMRLDVKLAPEQLSSPSWTDTLIELASPKRSMSEQSLYAPPFKTLANSAAVSRH